MTLHLDPAGLTRPERLAIQQVPRGYPMKPQFMTEDLRLLRAALCDHPRERSVWLQLYDAYQEAGFSTHEARHMVYMDVLPFFDSRRLTVASNAMADRTAVGMAIRAAVRHWTDCSNGRVPIMVVNDRIPPIRLSRSGVRVTRQCRSDFPFGRVNVPQPVHLPPMAAETIFVGCAWVCRLLRTLEGRFTPTHEFAWSDEVAISRRASRRKGVSGGTL